MRKIGDKKGQGHIEIIISFVMFIGFTFFLLFYIQPTKKSAIEDSTLLGIKNAFFANTSTNLTIVLVNSTSQCRPTGIDSPATYLSVNSPTGSNFFYIWSSPEFVNSPYIPPLCTSIPVNYTAGYTTNEIVLSNDSMQIIKKMYYSNYETLKAQFGVPETVDFSISSDGYSLESNIPQNTEVQSVLYRQEVLYANGTLVNQDFTFKIW